MPLVINTNVQSLNAQRQLVKSGNDMSQAMERLSSGKRINTAADDAAGLSISNRMTSQVRGLNQAIRNANDGVSLIQTAEGALDETTNILQRIRELAIQSSNGIYDDSNRKTLDAEVQQLKAELDRISETTSFNGQKLLNGSLGQVTLQVGAQAGEFIDLNVGELSTDTLGAAQDAGLSNTSRFYDNPTAGAQGLTVGDLTVNGIAIGGTSSADDSASTSNADASAIALAAAINKVSDLSGVKATVNSTVMAGASMTPAAGTSGTFTINGVTTASITTTADGATTRSAVVAAINAVAAQTGVTAIDTGEDATGVKLVAEDGRNISLTASAAGLTPAITGLRLAATSTNEALQIGSVTLQSVNGAEVVIGGDTSLTPQSGFVAGTFSGVLAQATSASHEGADDATTQLQAGDLVINGIQIGGAKALDDTASTVGKTGSAIAIAAAINRVAEATGVTADVTGTTIKGQSSTTAETLGNTLTFTVNGISIGTVTSVGEISADRVALVDAINKVSGQTGVVARDTGSGVEMFAEDGRNITLGAAGGTGAAQNFGLGNAAGTAASTAFGQTTFGAVTLGSGAQIEITAGANGVAGLEGVGFRAGTFGATESGQLLKDVSIATLKGAQEAIQAVDNALETINAVRADLGAINNRLDFTTSNLMNVVENTAAARSRIMDADFAAETANLSRAQVLQQASQAMLAQANASTQQVLQLLNQ
ncbi:flagellin [Simiduia agarivorans]|uniref:Flagellin n=1 Tax=Simiduia agarivorans (strain DSM 21679 / JCM 13881 / BCRC 17597 / SA1) TaxID=1117647 RepID=K4KUT8_SIMAS|nr:flagellin [Simiduia agarivorans]AFU97672.1 flagellin/flagellar hook associated protein [Simiduia agarivorans SA1 = DSM 21679]